MQKFYFGKNIMNYMNDSFVVEICDEIEDMFRKRLEACYLLNLEKCVNTHRVFLTS